MIFPRRYAKLVFPVLMSTYMVTIMTGLVTALNTGLADGFFIRWGQAFYIAWPVAFILVLIGGPRIQRLSVNLVKADLAEQKKAS
ncbi:MAG: DUF2798 domain-containing protein [Aeromonadales bacterium]|nr:DUF2798 domain-containing protein [Aeromonadales bacterium]